MCYVACGDGGGRYEAHVATASPRSALAMPTSMTQPPYWPDPDVHLERLNSKQADLRSSPVSVDCTLYTSHLVGLLCRC